MLHPRPKKRKELRRRKTVEPLHELLNIRHPISTLAFNPQSELLTFASKYAPLRALMPSYAPHAPLHPLTGTTRAHCA